jgi:hypothetical protein
VDLGQSHNLMGGYPLVVLIVNHFGGWEWKKSDPIHGKFEEKFAKLINRFTLFTTSSIGLLGRFMKTNTSSKHIVQFLLVSV